MVQNMKNIFIILFVCFFSAPTFSQTDKAPKPVAPYSQSRMTASGLLFISGQIPINPETGELLKDDIRNETRQVMENIGAILEANNMTYADLVKCTIFLTDIKDYQAVNEIYGSFFKDKFPAREAIEIGNLPLGAGIEISGIASK
jgi:2-iminobutanoate/2-iminopropanoate deaminase